MNISLVFPPYALESLYSLPPLGLVNLATAARQAGHAPRIHDCVLDLREGALPMGPGLYAACAERILDAAPDMVAFSAQCATYPAMINIARELRRRRPELPLVAGGHNASFVDCETLDKFPEFDAVVRGEGERTFPELADALASGRPAWTVSGVTGRRDGRAWRAPDRSLVADLDSLPRPDHSLAPELWRYQRAYDLPRAIAILEVGRGCPHACVYCSESALWQRRSRTFSPDRLAAEMLRLRDEQGAQSFLLSYDQFTANRDFVRRFCQAVLDAGLADCDWYCISRLDTVDAELFALMHQAGCRSMCYGIDSGSPRTLAFINKRIDQSVLLDRVRLTTEHGMTPTLSFIIGFPEEDLADIDATLTLALRCSILGNVSPLVQLPTVLPGTRLHAGYAKDLVREADTYFALGLEFDHGRRLAADEALINGDPPLFSSFYNLPCQGLAVRDLGAVASFFPLILDAFPKTFFLLATALAASPTRLFLDFLAHAAKARDGDQGLTASLCRCHFPAFAQSRLAGDIGRDWPLAAQMLRYEIAAGNAAGEAGRTALAPDRPALAQGVALAEFDTDMAEAVADLRRGVVRQSAPPAPCALIFSQRGNRLGVRRVNLFGKDVLARCDGTRTLPDIAGELRPIHGAAMPMDAFADHCHAAVAAFSRLGLVTAMA